MLPGIYFASLHYPYILVSGGIVAGTGLVIMVGCILYDVWFHD